MVGRDIRPICQPREAQRPSRLLLCWHTDLLAYLHWVWTVPVRRTEKARNEPLDHYVSVMVCVHTLARRCKNTGLLSMFNIYWSALQSVWQSQSVNFQSWGWLIRQGRLSVSTSVCYRVGLRGLAKRLCLAWIPGSCRNPTAITTPTQANPPPDSPHSSTSMEPVPHTAMDLSLRNYQPLDLCCNSGVSKLCAQGPQPS